MKRLAVALSLAIMASLFTVTVALGHHVNTVQVNPSCKTQDVVSTITHDIHSGHKLEWEVYVDGSKVGGALQLPDSRFNTTVTAAGVVPFGQGTIKVRARATFSGGSPESEWVEGTARYDCPKPPPPPPPREIDVNITAKGMLCGDPRAWNRYLNRGDTRVRVEWSFIDGNKSKPATRIYVTRWVYPNVTKTVGSRWVRAQVRVRVQDPVTKEWHRLFSYKVGKTLRPRAWNKGGCPANRFGTPSFGRPMARGSYVAIH